MQSTARRPALVALLTLLLLPLAVAAQPPAETEDTGPETASPEVLGNSEGLQSGLPPRFQRWLDEVDPLILTPERQVFLYLKTDYQRDEFIRRFWQVRDPYLQTARNELKERWDRRVSEAKAAFGTLQDDRARIYLVHGRPAVNVPVRCTTTRTPVEIWVYRGSNTVSFDFILLFVRQRGDGPARLWTPGSISLDSVMNQARACINGNQMVQAISLIRQNLTNYELAMQRVLAKPRPRSREWLATFVSLTTDVPPGAAQLPALAEIDFLGRYQSRTVLQGILRVPAQAAVVGDFAGFRSYNFLLTGEVVKDGSLLENFRYKFGFPTRDLTDNPLASSQLASHQNASPLPEDLEIPLAFQRYLRPGDYQLILRLEDLNGGTFFRRELDVSVPQMDTVAEVARQRDAESEQLFAEATDAIASGETSIRILPPGRELLVGFERFNTLAVGEDIRKITFYLDDQPILTKNRPPFNVEIDLGDFPQLRELRAEALDEAGNVVATDSLLINSGGNRFGVKLIEPHKGGSYRDSLLAKVEVEVPEDRTLERVELYLNETLMATLYQEPFTQPIALPPGEPVAYVRAVAYLPDGNSTEDLVFINAPAYLDEVDVQFVELFTTVLDDDDRPVAGLSRSDFTISEDGVEQTIQRFENVEDLPIHVGVLLDSSGSMRRSLVQAREAALTFFRNILTPKDRAAVITFNRVPTLAVKLTNDLTQLGGGLAGLTAEGETSLYDSVLFGLYYFTGIKGQRALLLLSDGRDEGSRFTFDDTLEYARRAGVTIYTVGLGLRDGDARSKLMQLAEETGGGSYFITEIEQLETIYAQIESELRSKYFLAYQSSNNDQDSGFRAIEVEMEDRDLEAKTLSGYYP